jgi:hypothetical protein
MSLLNAFHFGSNANSGFNYVLYQLLPWFWLAVVVLP